MTIKSEENRKELLACAASTEGEAKFFMGKGEDEKALQKFEICLGIYEKLGLEGEAIFVLDDMCKCLANLGRHEEAITHLERLENIYSDRGEYRKRLFVINELGKRHMDIGKRDEDAESYEVAIRYFVECEEKFTLYGMMKELSYVLDCHAESLMKIGKIRRDARTYYRKALPFWKRCVGIRRTHYKKKRPIAYSLDMYAKCLRVVEEFGKAEKACNDSYAILQSMKKKYLIDLSLNRLLAAKIYAKWIEKKPKKSILKEKFNRVIFDAFAFIIRAFEKGKTRRKLANETYDLLMSNLDVLDPHLKIDFGDDGEISDYLEELQERLSESQDRIESFIVYVNYVMVKYYRQHVEGDLEYLKNEEGRLDEIIEFAGEVLDSRKIVDSGYAKPKRVIAETIEAIEYFQKVKQSLQKE